MEETVKVTVFGHEKILTKESIANLEPFFSEIDLKQIHLPLWMDNFKPKMKVLHPCIYYTLLVSQELQHFRSLDFREKCLLGISDYYIDHRMNFQLYEYSHLCSKILSVPLDRTMHIIYFLIYARLASRPYISRLISEAEKKGRHVKKIVTIRSQKPYLVHSRSRESKHTTIFCDSINTDGLRKQLGAILGPQAEDLTKTKKIENKRFFDIKRIKQNDSELKKVDDQHEKTTNCHSIATSRVAIASKVHNRQNSSIISRLKVESGIISEDNLFKKVHVRRQKFGDQFESTEKYLNFLKEKQQHQNNISSEYQKKKLLEGDSKKKAATYHRSQKNAFESFQKIASNIRNKNELFDSIRYAYVNLRDKNRLSCKENFNRDYNFSRYTLKPKIDNIDQNQEKITKHIATQQNESKEAETPCLLSKNLNNSVKLNQTNHSGRSSQVQFTNYFSNSITRKDENSVVEQQPVIFFNQNLKKKLDLQKYKQEYRHFLKCQLLQRTKED